MRSLYCIAYAYNTFNTAQSRFYTGPLFSSHIFIDMNRDISKLNVHY